MVQIVVRMSGGEGWGLVELQGQLETRDQAPFDDMHIGDLHFDLRGTPSLVVGHHLLTGKVIELEKPFAILRKRSAAGDGKGCSELDVMEGEGNAADTADVEWGTRMGLDSATKACTEYEVVALITKKIIFKNRPKPIITKPLPRKV